MDVFKTSTETWKFFRKYHYLNHDLNNSAQCYVAEWEGKIVGFIAILHFPHPSEKRWKNVSRLVVLPDYQGVGIGVALLEVVGRIYLKQGFRYKIVTSNPVLCYYFNKSDNWKCIRQGRVRKVLQESGMTGLNKTISINRLTTSWEYKLSK